MFGRKKKNAVRLLEFPMPYTHSGWSATTCKSCGGRAWYQPGSGEFTLPEGVKVPDAIAVEFDRHLSQEYCMCQAMDSSLRADVLDLVVLPDGLEAYAVAMHASWDGATERRWDLWGIRPAGISLRHPELFAIVDPAGAWSQRVPLWVKAEYSVRVEEFNFTDVRVIRFAELNGKPGYPFS